MKQMQIFIEVDPWNNKGYILSATHNGHNWTSLRLGNLDEVKQIHSFLDKFLKEEENKEK